MNFHVQSLASFRQVFFKYSTTPSVDSLKLVVVESVHRYLSGLYLSRRPESPKDMVKNLAAGNRLRYL